MSPPIDPDLIALETLLGRKKQLTSLLISLDAYRRWGNGSDPEFEAFATRETAGFSRVEDELTALSKRIRARRVDIFEQWAHAHVELLEDYLTRVAEDSTEAFVARKECDAWRAVVEGTLDFVDENPGYVKPDPETYQRLFGVPLPKFYW